MNKTSPLDFWIINEFQKDDLFTTHPFLSVEKDCWNLQTKSCRIHCVAIFFWYSEIIDCICLQLKIEFRSCASGCHWCGIFHCNWWKASIKRRLLFSSCRLFFLRAFSFHSWIQPVHNKLLPRKDMIWVTACMLDSSRRYFGRHQETALVSDIQSRMPISYVLVWK